VATLFTTIAISAQRDAKPPTGNPPPAPPSGRADIVEVVGCLTEAPPGTWIVTNASDPVVYPDGREESLLRMPRFEHGWQINHELEAPLRLPAGSKVVAYGHCDNSLTNRFNPAPHQEVFSSEQSWDEMYHPYIEIVYDARDITKPSTTAQQP
jgi:hypothetical protein